MEIDQVFDIVIVGGGVIGCAALFNLTNKGYKCILLEKNEHLVSEASAGNSGMLHTGFDAPLESLELHCIQQSQKHIFDVLHKFELPCRRVGATMVAWDQSQLSKLPDIITHSHQAEISDIRQLSLSELYQREPNLVSGATGAIHIPGETIVDPWLIPIVFAEHARTRGAKIYTNTIARNFDFDASKQTWTINTNKGNVRSLLVINCCGLYGDIIDRLTGNVSFKIKPRKGQYLIFDKTANGTINSSLLPVPTETTKGVIVFNSVYNNVVIGPTAEETNDRFPQPDIDPLVTSRLTNFGANTIPSLMSHDVVRMYTGVRPATEKKEYQIVTRIDRNWLTVGGIRSTGLSACLGIADHVYSIVKDKFGIEPSSAVWNTVEKVGFNFTKRDSAVFQTGKEHIITHPLTFTGHENQIFTNSNL